MTQLHSRVSSRLSEAPSMTSGRSSVPAKKLFTVEEALASEIQSKRAAERKKHGNPEHEHASYKRHIVGKDGMITEEHNEADIRDYKISCRTCKDMD